LLSIINAVGLKHVKRAQDIFTIPKILAMVAVIAFGLFSKKGNISYLSSPPIICDKGIILSFGLALIPILWTYGGWHENTFMSEETKNARTTIPLALIAGIFVVTAVYLGMNYIYMYLIPVKEIAHTKLVAADALQILCGKGGRKILEGFIVISSLGCINAMIMTGSRITYAMARDNVIFKYVGEVNEKYKTPVRSIVINAGWSIALIILGTFNGLLFFTGVLVWLFFMLVTGGLFILRRKFPDIERPYKVWGYPFLPAIFILICAALFIDTIIFYPFQSLMGLCILGSGIPMFMISRKKKVSV
jgi:APA family basic amino acid/polyamine antiporter